MMRTRRSLLRTVSGATAAAIGVGTISAASSEPAEPGATDRSNLVERSRIRTTDQRCAEGAGEDSDALRFGRYVLFRGRIGAPNPCHQATIVSTELDGETLVVTIGVESEPDVEACIDCVGIVEYHGHLLLSDPDAVEAVEVRHVDASAPADPVEEYEIETTDQSCLSGGSEPGSKRAELSIDAVEFSGSMETPTPCYEAVVESIDIEGDTLVITVDAERQDGVEICIDCIGETRYEGTVTLSDPAALEDAVVRHV